MLKRIPKSDISIRPFKAYKEWSFDSGSTEIDVLTASDVSSSLSVGNITSFAQNSIYGQLRAQFYNGNEDNPFIRFGDKLNNYQTAPAAKDRFLSGSAKVISIPQIYVGEGIKKGSTRIVDNDSIFIDDSHGNLIENVDRVVVTKIDTELNDVIFKDLLESEYNVSFQEDLGDVDISSGTFNLVYNGQNYNTNIVSFDANTGVLVIDNIPFLQEGADVSKIGNIFYSQGLIVITRNVNDLLLGNWDLTYKSTKTIYEHEYLLIANEDEFNVSQNPSAIVNVGGAYESFTDTIGKVKRIYTSQPTKYIRKAFTLENGTGSLDYSYTYSGSVGNYKAGFEHYELSGSLDSTGSFLAPFITTIGLYDDNCDLVAVAKLPQPIKSEPDIPVNFIVRFDT